DGARSGAKRRVDSVAEVEEQAHQLPRAGRGLALTELRDHRGSQLVILTRPEVSKRLQLDALKPPGARVEEHRGRVRRGREAHCELANLGRRSGRAVRVDNAHVSPPRQVSSE